jgi:hypothetical protein
MCAKAQAGRRRPWATHLPQPHVAKLRAFLVEPEPGAPRAAHVLLRAVEAVDRGRVKVRLPAPHGAVKHEWSNTSGQTRVVKHSSEPPAECRSSRRRGRQQPRGAREGAQGRRARARSQLRACAAKWHVAEGQGAGEGLGGCDLGCEGLLEVRPPARGTWRVRFVRGQGRGVST